MTTGGITLETARQHLQRWLDAEFELATSQSYTIGTRQLTRANLNAVRAEIEYWSGKVAQLELAQSGKRRNRAYTVVPRHI
ncbi:hypothetical protein FACS1894217_04790 [Clostridia bacterium]|nr:hypothetical protein FACS1894217_04790 [Clostridia bacterium]